MKATYPSFSSEVDNAGQNKVLTAKIVHGAAHAWVEAVNFHKAFSLVTTHNILSIESKSYALGFQNQFVGQALVGKNYSGFVSLNIIQLLLDYRQAIKGNIAPNVAG